MQIFTTMGAMALLFLPAWVRAQSLFGGFMNGEGRGAVALSYTAERYSEVFLVPADADRVPIFNKMEVNSINLYATYGLSPRLDFVLNLPYIQAKGHASQATLEELGFKNERKGLQDISIYLKYRIRSIALGAHRMDFLAAGGVRTPVSNYEVERGLQSIVAIGNRASTLNGVGVVHFRTRIGFYLTGQGGYSYRTGQVPDAFVGEARVGYGTRRFQVAAWYAQQVSTGGVHILGEGFDGFFPATDVSYTRAGLNVYVPTVSGFGVSAGVNKYVSGRNVGKAIVFTGAVVFAFRTSSN